MNFLSLDLGAHTGWIVMNDSGLVLYGGTKEHKIKSSDNKAMRWIYYTEWLSNLLDDIVPDTVYVENFSRHKGVHAAHAYGYYRYALESECLKRKIPVIGFSVGEWKKLATGKGNSKKDEVAIEVSKKYPDIVFETDDHSDALGISIAAHIVRNSVSISSTKGDADENRVHGSRGDRKKHDAKLGLRENNTSRTSAIGQCDETSIRSKGNKGS